MSDKTKIDSKKTIDVLLEEERTFDPPENFTANANINDPAIYQFAQEHPEAYWERFADELDWSRKWDKVLDWNPPDVRWFVGGKINACYNCVDRHVKNGMRNKAAIIWEGEPGEKRTLTYWDLYREVNKFANALKNLGIKKGDRVAIYLPMVPELVIAMLACARIGAIHSVIFAGEGERGRADRFAFGPFHL